MNWIEALFREEAHRPDLVLADVFDLIAGTSTGAIIAAFLSWGKTVAEIEQLYLDAGPLMFRRQHWWLRQRSKYGAEAIAEFFRTHFVEVDGRPANLGSAQLRTKLLIVMRNATTGSPWPVTNNPDAHYNHLAREDCNLNVPLWQLLRASTAAPSFFPPERIDFGPQPFLFVDGGVTPFNNPALIAVLTATLPQYRLNWQVGRNNLHVISVGTGLEHAHLPPKVAAKINLLDQLRYFAPAFIGAVSVEQDLVCRIIGNCRFGEPIDREVGGLDTASLFPPAEQKFTYVRYNQALNTGASLKSDMLDARLDHVENMPMFQRMGRTYAAEHVRAEHLNVRNL